VNAFNVFLDHVLCLEAEIFGPGEQMRVIRIDEAETGLSRARQMNSVGRAQKHRWRQVFVDLSDQRKNVIVLGKPVNAPCSMCA